MLCCPIRLRRGHPSPLRDKEPDQVRDKDKDGSDMALPIPTSGDDVTDAWLERLLRGHHDNGYRLTAARETTIKGNQVAVCSEMRCVNCSGRLGESEVEDHLVVKLLPRDATMRAVVTSLKLAQCETNVYRELLPRLSEYERARGRDAIAAMTSHCLHAAIDGDGDGLRSVVVLENLQPQGFWTPDPAQLPEDALPEAVRQLARLAATSNCWLRHHDLHALPYLVSTRLPTDHLAGQFFRTSVAKLDPLLRERGQQPLLQKLQRLQEVATHTISRELQPRDVSQRVVTHGDFREGNMLLRRAAGGGWDVRIVDWQAAMLSHPAVDLVYLLYVSLPRDVRRRAERQVREVYAEEFAATARALGAPSSLTPGSLAEDLRQAKLLGMMWALCCVNFWERVPDWAEHCVDVALEVDNLGLLDEFSPTAEEG